MEPSRWLDLAKDVLQRPTAGLVFILFIVLIHTAPLGAMAYMSYRIEFAVVRLTERVERLSDVLMGRSHT